MVGEECLLVGERTVPVRGAAMETEKDMAGVGNNLWRQLLSPHLLIGERSERDFKPVGGKTAHGIVEKCQPRGAVQAEAFAPDLVQQAHKTIPLCLGLEGKGRGRD